MATRRRLLDSLGQIRRAKRKNKTNSASLIVILKIGCNNVLKWCRYEALNQKTPSEQVTLRDVDLNTIEKEKVR
jgi:hypothetical protein